MTILVVYGAEPAFPAVDQNPSAARYHIGLWWVDAIDGEPTPDEVAAFLTPPVVAPHLNNDMLIRFSATNPIVVYENLGLAGVARLAKGRYRITHTTPMPTDSYSIIPDLLDAADKRIRATVRTATYVEVKIVDAAGAAADATEATVNIKRVIN